MITFQFFFNLFHECTNQIGLNTDQLIMDCILNWLVFIDDVTYNGNSNQQTLNQLNINVTSKRGKLSKKCLKSKHHKTKKEVGCWLDVVICKQGTCNQMVDFIHVKYVYSDYLEYLNIVCWALKWQGLVIQYWPEACFSRAYKSRWTGMKGRTGQDIYKG